MSKLSFSKPLDDPDLRVISLGAGVQSSVLALMAARRDVGPMPDCAIFSDTQFEPQYIYDWLDWLETQLPFPIIRVTKGNLKRDTMKGLNSTGQRFAAIPFFMKDDQNKEAIGRRQCTTEYKIEPVVQEIRKQLGLKPGQQAKGKFIVEQWIGISTDEMVRLKINKHKWIINRWPLIEEGMNRHDCLRWMEERQFPTPKKSSCIGCPFHNNEFWRDMKINHPSEFEEAVEFDRAIRNDARGQNKYEQYLHRSCKPLEEVDFDNDEDLGQISFLDECEGMCGV